MSQSRVTYLTFLKLTSKSKRHSWQIPKHQHSVEQDLLGHHHLVVTLGFRTNTLVPFWSLRETFQIQRKMEKKGRFRGHPEGYCLLSSASTSQWMVFWPQSHACLVGTNKNSEIKISKTEVNVFLRRKKTSNQIFFPFWLIHPN